MADPLTIHHTLLPGLTPMGMVNRPGTKGEKVTNTKDIKRSLPDQVHGWPPEKNIHGHNRAKRRLGAKMAKKSQKALTKALNSAAGAYAKGLHQKKP